MVVFSSPLEPVDVPESNLPDFILKAISKYGDREALVDGYTGRSLTYNQIANGIENVSKNLARKYGVKKGDVIAIYSPNTPEYVIMFHGIGKSGGIATTVSPLYPAEDLERQVVDASASIIMTIPQFLDKAMTVAEKVEKVTHVFVLGLEQAREAGAEIPEGKSVSVESFTSLMLPPEDNSPLDVSFNPKEDVVVLPYSSGTSGLPKGVQLTHMNIVSNILQTQKVEPINSESVLFGVLPFFHIYAMTLVLSIALVNGGKIVVVHRFELEKALEIMQKYKVNRGHLVPPILLALAKHPIVDKYDLSALKVVVSGAAPLSRELALAVNKRLGIQVKQGYGMTETSPVTHVMLDTDSEDMYGYIGPLIPNTQAKVKDLESGEELGVGEEGELCIKGPQVMKGYLNRPEDNKTMFDEEGFMRTGDVAVVDENGYWKIVDRCKELIKYKGYQVPPAELEGVLLKHPSINDVAVIPVPDEECGELPKAYVVLKQGENMTEQDVINFSAEHVAPYKKIRLVEFTDAIPKSASGKILRRVLKLQERERAMEKKM